MHIYDNGGVGIEMISAILIILGKTVRFLVFSSDERDPRYTTGETTRQEGEVVIDLSKDMTLDTERLVRMSMQFGGSSMEVKAEAVNFSLGGATELELPVEVEFC